MIEGITACKEPNKTNKGHLEPPEEFDSRKYVGRWEKVGARANRAMQPEQLGNSGYTANGWEVWKDGHKRPCKRSLASGVYIFLCRPKALQEAVQKIYGNLSRQQMLREANGETVAGQEIEDTGILTLKSLKSIPGLDREDASEHLDIPLNRVAAPEDEPSARASSRAKTKLK